MADLRPEQTPTLIGDDARQPAPPPRSLTALQVAVIALVLVEGATLLTASVLYLRQYATLAPAVVGALALLAVAGAVWFLPRKSNNRRSNTAALSVLLLVLLLPPLSTLWPGGITASRFGLTVVGICPIPVLDITMNSSGRLWFRNKTHWITADEVRPLIDAKTQVLVIGIGWQSMAKVDPRVRQLVGPKIEVLPTPQAFALYDRLRREGKRVALLAHSTC